MSDTCVHRWLCQPPVGGVVAARCKKCGKERTYNNDPPADYSYGTRDMQQASKKSRLGEPNWIVGFREEGWG